MSPVYVDRPGLYRFLIAMRDKQGAFRMHEGGEVDIRSVLCGVDPRCVNNGNMFPSVSGHFVWFILSVKLKIKVLEWPFFFFVQKVAFEVLSLI